jgi:hypothetical protein
MSASASASSVTASASAKPPLAVRRCAAAQCGADVLGQHADVGALAAGDFQRRQRRLPVSHRKPLDPRFARHAVELDALARVRVIGAAVALQRRMHWRHLQDAPAKGRQRRLDGGAVEVDRRGGDHLAVDVATCRADAEAHLRHIRLVRVEQHLRELGGVAEAQWQKAGGEGIERAGVPGLLGFEQALRRLQRGIRRHAGRLVEQQHAVDAPSRPAWLRHRHSLSWLRSEATASSISFDRRMPDSIESS